MMDGVADLNSGSAELDFINTTSSPVVIKPRQIVATAIQIDSVETLPHIEPDDDKSIPSNESVFSGVKKMDDFVYPSIASDEMMDADEDQFDLDMNIVEAPLSRPKTIPREKGTLIDCVQDLFNWACKNISPEESAMVKEVLVEHNETTLHDTEKHLMRPDTIEHGILTTGRHVMIPS